MNLFKKTILLSYICIASVSATIVTPALVQIQNTFHLNDHAVQWIVSIFLFGYVIGQLIYGPIANRYGSLTALRFGLIINLAGIILSIIAVAMANYQLLLLGRLISALGAASGLSCTFMLIHAYLNDKETQHLLSFCIVSFTLGLGLSILIGGLTIQYLRFEDLFIILLIHGILTYITTFIFKNPNNQANPKNQNTLNIKTIIQGYLNVLKKKNLIIFSLMLGSVTMFSYGYAYSAPLFAINTLHLSPSNYGYWNLLTILGMLLGGVLSAFLIKRLSANHLLKLSILLVLPGLVSLILLSLSKSHNPLWFFITMMYLYAAFGLIFPTASYFATSQTSDKASASSMMSFINMLSATLGVILIGSLAIDPIVAFISVLGIFFIIISLLTLRQLTLIIKN